ncbi:MAG TPA: sugar porter family MFS transporter [Steroidobacteraceae bacterium]|nr:sugar porter family MFS transporter [Steroidobacteraceae bacterium]
MSQPATQVPGAASHTGLLVALTIIAALGGFLFGYDSAVISGAIESIKLNFVAPLGLAEEARLSLEGFTIAGALWGCLIGGAIGGVMAHYLGRRGGLMVAGVLFFVSSLGSAWPESFLGGLGSVLTPLINALIWFLNLFFEDAPYLKFGDPITNFIGHRLFGGMGIGLASMLAPMYIAEIAPPSKRGSLVTYQQIAIVSGITISYFVNYFIKKFGGDGDSNWVHETGWRWMLACCAVPAGIFVLLLFFVPETPRGLMLKGKAEKANAVLKRLANESEAKIVLAEIDASLKETAGKLFSYGGLVIVVGILLSAFQQLVGINAVLYYGPQMFENMGFKGDASFAQTVIMGIVMTAFTLVATVTVDKWGRKPLLILGALIMAVAMIALGFMFDAGSVGLGALIVVCIYIAGFSLSWGPVVWVMLAEIFPNSIRDKAMAIAVAAQWFMNWVVTVTFNIMDGSTALNAAFNHGFAYWLYGGFSVIAALFVWKFVPESKGVKLEAMKKLWKQAPAAAA